MPISKGHLKKNQRTLDIDYFGDNVRVVYKPSEITPAVMAEMTDAVTEGDQLFTPRILAKTMTQWDLAVDDSDMTQTVPITFEELRELDSGFLARILQALTEDMFPKARNGRR